MTYAVRISVVSKYTGQLLLLLTMLTLPSLFIALFFGEYSIAISYLYTLIFLLIVSLPLSRLSVPGHIQLNEALVITSLAFILTPLIMTYPLVVSGLPFQDALFEAISAITTTGLTTVTDLENRPITFLFSRAWMQWYGGLGIVILSIALLMGHHLAARQLAEPLSSETMAYTARNHARRMVIVYLLMTLTGLVILWLLIGNGFDALLYVLTAVSTGGFAPSDSSLATLNDLPVRFAIVILALCGAIPLPLYYFAWRRKNVTTFLSDVELLGLLILTLTTCLLLTVFIHSQSGIDWQASITEGFLLGISAQTTSGFSNIDINDLGNSEKLITIISMLVGGGLGSTAGGMKVIRLLILFRLVHLLVLRTAMPNHAIVKPSLGGRVLENELIQRTLLLVLLFIAVVLISWFIFIAFGYPPLNSLFEVVSATGTVGLSTGITHTELPAILKTVLCVDMLLGRLEIVALLIVLYPRTWIGRRVKLL